MPKLRPAEVAAETKRDFIPYINGNWADLWPPSSVQYDQPLQDLAPHIIKRDPNAYTTEFSVVNRDPVTSALQHATWEVARIPFICSAHDERAGGDWETACHGYEEKLCRRSNLSATLVTPAEGSARKKNYPILSEGAIVSHAVAVWRDEQYEKMPAPVSLPVVSVPPVKKPKLKDHGTHYSYSFKAERALMHTKIRAALIICLYHNYRKIVIGDFGLGKRFLNPPHTLAEIWRDVFLNDPDIRNQFDRVEFAFEDCKQNTTSLIYDEIMRKELKSRNKRNFHFESAPADLRIFQLAFSPDELEKAQKVRDPRYQLSTITA